MSAIIRRFINRGAALNVLRPQSNMQNFPAFCLITPRHLSNLNVLRLQQNMQNTSLTGTTAQRFLSNTKEPSDTTEKQISAEDVILDVKPEIERSIYDKLVNSNKVVVFMKGTPKSPRCGFSNAVVQIFRMHGVEYDAHDVLENVDVREGIKKYTDWPTIPQVFINGEFVGGCDILLEMHQSGELIEKLNKVGIVSHLLRLEREVEAKEAKANKDKNNNK